MASPLHSLPATGIATVNWNLASPLALSSIQPRKAANVTGTMARAAGLPRVKTKTAHIATASTSMKKWSKFLVVILLPVVLEMANVNNAAKGAPTGALFFSH